MFSLNPLTSENILLQTICNILMFVVVIMECKEDKIEDSETHDRPSAICETARI